MNILRILKVAGPIYDLVSEYRDNIRLRKGGHFPSDEEVLRSIYTGQGIPDLKHTIDKTLDIVAPKAELYSTRSKPKTPAEVISNIEGQVSDESIEDEDYSGGGHVVVDPEIGHQDKRGMRSPEECLDCSFKHLSTARVNLEEAVQWLNNNEPKEKVMRKIHTAFDQLAGAEEATRMTNDKGVAAINKDIRDTRKKYWESGMALDVNNPEEIKEFNNTINGIYDKTLKVAKARRGSPTVASKMG